MDNILDSEDTRHLPFGPGGELLHFGNVVAADVLILDEDAAPDVPPGMVATDLRLSASSVYAAAREAGQTVMRPTGEVGTVAMTRFVPVARFDAADPADLDDATFERVAHALADAIGREMAA